MATKKRDIIKPEPELLRYGVTNILDYMWVVELLETGKVEQKDIEDEVNVIFELSGGQIFPTHTPAYGYMQPFEKPTLFI